MARIVKGLIKVYLQEKALGVKLLCIDRILSLI